MRECREILVAFQHFCRRRRAVHQDFESKAIRTVLGACTTSGTARSWQRVSQALGDLHNDQSTLHILSLDALTPLLQGHPAARRPASAGVAARLPAGGGGGQRGGGAAERVAGGGQQARHTVGTKGRGSSRVQLAKVAWRLVMKGMDCGTFHATCEGCGRRTACRVVTGGGLLPRLVDASRGGVSSAQPKSPARGWWAASAARHCCCPWSHSFDMPTAKHEPPANSKSHMVALPLQGAGRRSAPGPAAVCLRRPGAGGWL